MIEFKSLGGAWKSYVAYKDGVRIASIRKQNTLRGYKWMVNHVSINGNKFFDTRELAFDFIRANEPTVAWICPEYQLEDVEKRLAKLEEVDNENKESI